MELTQFQRENIEILAEHMDKRVPREQFNMGTWGEGCGTVGCAFGHAVRCHKLNRRGLSYSERETKIWGWLQPKVRGRVVGISKAISEFFGGTHFYLFVGDPSETIKTPKQWARHARKFLRENS